uniref:Uncharacterized protein n=1 Tax=Siphoviridae sp. ctxMM9 TaxID=2827973 RepID=A0A8S5T7E0_9CAUD|nr:MAG TPA: hypothetical protein [Siphoviridae sp. ctxMM9]
MERVLKEKIIVNTYLEINHILIIFLLVKNPEVNVDMADLWKNVLVLMALY